MADKKRSYQDISDRAASALAYSLTEAERAAAAEDQIGVEEAIADVPVLEYDSGRSRTRVLFVTGDTTFIDPTNNALDMFYDVSKQFDEMHIIVLRQGIKPRSPVLRVRENIWIYVAHADFWWWTPVIASEVVAKNELVFAEGFRPDVVVALEPYEAGFAALRIGKLYDRPVQVQVREDFFVPAFKRRRPNNAWRQLLAKYVLKRTFHVVAATESIEEKLSGKLGLPGPFLRLPQFHHFAELRDAPVNVDLHAKYPDYEFIMLFVGPLTYESRIHKLIDAIKHKLANPRVGLIVVGSGRAKQELKEKVEKIGIITQVAFIEDTKEVASYLKTADLLLVPDTDGDSNETTMRGAVVGIPMIMAETEQRQDLFNDGESAFLCDEGDAECMAKKLNSFMHEPETYIPKFKEELARVVKQKLYEDPLSYRQSYRDTIESVFKLENYDESEAESDEAGE